MCDDMRELLDDGLGRNVIAKSLNQLAHPIMMIEYRGISQLPSSRECE